MDHAGDVLYYVSEALAQRTGSLDIGRRVEGADPFAVQGAYGWGKDQPFALIAVSLDADYRAIDDETIAMVVEVLHRLRDQGP